MIKIQDREFDEDKIFPGKPGFDATSRNEYLNYLSSIPEKEVIKMDITHAYERIRFIAQKEQVAILKAQGYIPLNQRDGFVSSNSNKNNKPTKIYKNWTHD